VNETAIQVRKHLVVNPALAEHGPHRHVTAGERLGQHHDVRVHITVVFDGQKVAAVGNQFGVGVK
jgi:hypothetical protein